MLRRDEDPYGSHLTVDGRMRHTYDVGLANNFQRGASYRSSLQELNTTQRVSKFSPQNCVYQCDLIFRFDFFPTESTR